MAKPWCICNDDDMMMHWMGQELKGFAEKGHIFELDEAWFRYRELAGESGHDIPRLFKSRKGYFKDKLPILKNCMNFVC